MMRRTTLTAIPLLLAAGAVLLWLSRGNDEAPVAVAQEVSAPEHAAVLGVDQLMRAVDDHRGPVLVEGAVSAVVPAEQAIALIDVSEFAQCGVVTCAALTLPVHWEGPMPSVRDVVHLTGEVKESSGKLVFFASTLEKVDFDAEGSQ
jgi:hypothetical protein